MMIKTCTAVFIVAVLIRIGRQPSAVRVASAISIAGAVSLIIWYSNVGVIHPQLFGKGLAAVDGLKDGRSGRTTSSVETLDGAGNFARSECQSQTVSK